MTEFDAFKYFWSVPIMYEDGSVVVLSLILLKIKSLKSWEEKLNKNCSIYSFVKSNLNGIYPDLRLISRMKITFFQSNSFVYCSIKISVMSFKNLVKNFKSLLNVTV